MLKRFPIILVLIVTLAIPIIVLPVSGESGSDNSPVLLWSDAIGVHKSLVACSGDGRYILAGSDTGILRMYNRDGVVLWTFDRDGKAVRSVAISGNGDYAGAVFLNEEGPSSSAYGEVVFFNRNGNVRWVTSTDPTVELITISDDSNAVYVSAGSGILYSYSRDGAMLAKNTTDGRIWALDSSRDGSYAAAGSQITGNRLMAMKKDGITAWNYSTKAGFGSVDISPDGGSVAAAGYSHLYLFDRNGSLLWQYSGSTEFTSVAVSENRDYTVAGSQYYASLFNKTGSLLWKKEYEGFVHDVGISDDGNRIIAGMSRGLRVFDRDGNVLWYYKTPKAIIHISTARDTRIFAASTADTVYVFSSGGNLTTEKQNEIFSDRDWVFIRKSMTDLTEKEQDQLIAYWKKILNNTSSLSPDEQTNVSLRMGYYIINATDGGKPVNSSDLPGMPKEKSAQTSASIPLTIPCIAMGGFGIIRLLLLGNDKK